jgi:hypothetical protein
MAGSRYLCFASTTKRAQFPRRLLPIRLRRLTARASILGVPSTVVVIGRAVGIAVVVTTITMGSRVSLVRTKQTMRLTHVLE